jgi:hypothetical protein
MQVIAAGSLPKVKAANWVVGGDGMMEGMNPRSTAWWRGLFGRGRSRLLVGRSDGLDYCTYYCLSAAWDRRWRGRKADVKRCERFNGRPHASLAGRTTPGMIVIIIVPLHGVSSLHVVSTNIEV